MVPQDQLRKTKFYNDLLCKYEMESMTQLALLDPNVEGAVMTLWRRKQDGPMDEASISLLQMLLPHAHTAIKIRARLQAAKVQEHFHELALENLAIAAILVSAAGKIIHMNQHAAAIVQRADGLRLQGSTLAALNLKDCGRLSSLIAEAATTRRNGQRTASKAAPGGALTLNRKGTDRRSVSPFYRLRNIFAPSLELPAPWSLSANLTASQNRGRFCCAPFFR